MSFAPEKLYLKTKFTMHCCAQNDGRH